LHKGASKAEATQATQPQLAIQFKKQLDDLLE